MVAFDSFLLDGLLLTDGATGAQSEFARGQPKGHSAQGVFGPKASSWSSRNLLRGPTGAHQAPQQGSGTLWG